MTDPEHISTKRNEKKDILLPPLELDFFFGAHGSKVDAEYVREPFNKCDVFAPEALFWTEELRVKLNELSFGRIEPNVFIKETKFDQLPIGGFMLRIAEIIYQSFKPIALLEVPLDHPQSPKIIKHLEEASEETSPNPSIPFEKQLQKLREWFRKDEEICKFREHYVLGSLHRGVETALEYRKDLLQKPKLKVLIFSGMFHDSVSRELKSWGVAHNVLRPNGSDAAPYELLVRRRMSTGEGADNQLVSKALMELYVVKYLNVIMELYGHDDFARNTEILTKIVDSFTYDEIRGLFRSDNSKVFRVVLERILSLLPFQISLEELIERIDRKI